MGWLQFIEVISLVHVVNKFNLIVTAQHNLSLLWDASNQIDCNQLKPTSDKLQPTHQLGCNKVVLGPNPVNLGPNWKTTKMEDDQNGRRPEWKMTKMEDDRNERRPKWKTTKMEDDQNGTRPKYEWQHCKQDS